MSKMKQYAEQEAEKQLAIIETRVAKGELSLTEARDECLKSTVSWQLIGFSTIDELEEYLCTETAFKTIQ
tara:strand:- start:45 stop:254 length:210 start_codon:yes stop_codon:yes gene_type:complete